MLETFEYLVRETDVWVELTNLLIPGQNDDADETDRMTGWIVERLGPDVPVHFTAFHPDWKMRDVPPTPRSTLHRARDIALANGIHYAYTGNVDDPAGQTTWCHGCGTPVIGRDGYDLTAWGLDADGRCAACGTPCAGVFEAEPGAWGSQRLPVQMTGGLR
jgi:pyruvate formate lyase activating enzyme